MGNQKDRRGIIEATKCLIVLGGKDELISAKLALKFGGKAADYRGHVRQARKELKYSEIAEKAVLEHIRLGGKVHRNAKKFAGMVHVGPAKPECSFAALVIEAQKLVDEWSAVTLYGSEWRRRVDFAKDAIVEDGKEAEKLLAVRWPGDNPFLRQKVLAVASRELSKDVTTLAAVVINPDKKFDQGKKNKKAAKAARRQLDANRIKRIFGQRAA